MNPPGLEKNLSTTSIPNIDSSRFQEDAKTISLILDEVGKVLVGQEHMSRSLLIGLLTGGHVLLEGFPALRNLGRQNFGACSRR